MKQNRVSLIDYTGYGRPDDEMWHAAHLLLYTKSTRLQLDSALMDRIKALSEEEILTELEYMASTIPSSWEFADVTFLITGVTRACAQQITRTRTASFAMQSQRVVDASGADVTNPFPAGSALHSQFDEAQHHAIKSYESMLANGAQKQDARGILPMNVTCNLVAKYNFRSFVDLVTARSSLRTQGEYSQIVREMKEQVLDVWPWARLFFYTKHAQAISMLEQIVQDLGLETGSGTAWQIAKAIDLLRKAQ